MGDNVPIDGLKPKDVEGLKKRIMWSTRTDAALLAHYLGYGWCGGVNAKFPGDDMKMEGSSWVSNLTKTDGSTPTGVKWDQRLKITYGNWRFKLTDARFDDPIIDTEMKPDFVHSGILVNDDKREATLKASGKKEIVREVKIATADDFNWSRELGLSVTYKAPMVSGGIELNFNESNTTKTTDSTGKTMKKTFTVDQSKTLQPYTASRWYMFVSMMKVTAPFTANIVCEFSLTFDGFLRWGGADQKSANYHFQYHGKDSRPTVSYTFGSARETFPAALQDQSSAMKTPWLWVEAKKRYSNLQAIIDELLEPKQYQMVMSGVVNDIGAHDSVVRWKEAPLNIEN